MQVGTTKDQGLYSKPSAAVHPGALAAGTLPQYNTIVVLDVSKPLVSSSSRVILNPNSEQEGSTFLLNPRIHQPDYPSSHPRRLESSNIFSGTSSK